jgi:hypothetical protein
MGDNPPLSWNTVIELIMKLAIVLYSMGLGNYNILIETYVR